MQWCPWCRKTTNITRYKRYEERGGFKQTEDIELCAVCKQPTKEKHEKVSDLPSEGEKFIAEAT